MNDGLEYLDEIFDDNNIVDEPALDPKDMVNQVCRLWDEQEERRLVDSEHYGLAENNELLDEDNDFE